MVYVRKNHLAMTAEEKRRFVHAILAVKRSGFYDELVKIHIIMNSGDYLDKDTGARIGHVNPGFFPWHRQYLLELERELQRVDPSVTIPYWDWTTDQSQSSPLWAPEFMGGTGRPGDGQVTTGPFARRNGWRLNISVVPVGSEPPALNGHYTADDRDYLVRALGQSGQILSPPRELEDTMALPVYDCPPWSYQSGGTAPYNSFRNHLEGYTRLPQDNDGPTKLHGAGHQWIGGHMMYIGSPNDPVFFLHHCFIDKCWAMWQARHPDVPHYLPAEETTDVPSLHTILPPWKTMSPADLLDHTKFYTYH
ncbi:tyrosinase family protein [Amycolatopsis nigrescens]|uniref:tyrosinase family protein n=1 Tax=Amycolatopsis nigrescens TaxID=381445 RepID=UPI00037406DF|nr:tyrosinase family protein [Amycolatopsis nigrescens]